MAWLARALFLGSLIFIAIYRVESIAQVSGQRLSSRLVTDFQHALDHDPEWLAAIASRDASVEAYPQAKAALLPQIGFNAQRSQNSTDSSTQTQVGPLTRNFDNYPASSTVLQVRQALIRPKLWASLTQSKAQVRFAEQSFVAAKQDLALRLFSIHAELYAGKQAIDALSKQLAIQEKLSESALRQFLAGDSGRVDFELSRAQEHQLHAQLRQAHLEQENLLLSRRELTGISDSFEALTFDVDTAFKLLGSLGSSTEHWIDLAMRESPNVLAQIAAVDASREEIRKAGFDHYPTADLYASRSASKSAMDNTIGTAFRTAQIGMELSIPVYAGGAVESSIRKAQASLRLADQQLEATRAKIRLQIERDFRILEVSREELSAQREVQKALVLTLNAAIKGLRAGSSVVSEQLKIGSQLEDVQRRIARSNANALIAWARLLSVANRLRHDELQEVERLALQRQPSG